MTRADCIARLRAAGCDPVEMTWRPGTWQALCPLCRDRYLGRRLKIITADSVILGAFVQRIECACGCPPAAIVAAIEGGAA